MRYDGLGQDPIASALSPIADQIVSALMPKMKELVANASQSAKPVIEQVMTETVLPKFGLAVVLGLAAGAAVAAAIGSHFAMRGSARRNPRRRGRAA